MQSLVQGRQLQCMSRPASGISVTYIQLLPLQLSERCKDALGRYRPICCSLMQDVHGRADVFACSCSSIDNVADVYTQACTAVLNLTRGCGGRCCGTPDHSQPMKACRTECTTSRSPEGPDTAKAANRTRGRQTHLRLHGRCP